MKSPSLFGYMICLFVVFYCNSMAQQLYHIDVRSCSPVIKSGHLELGGTNVNGESIKVNSFYIERNDKPWFPVIGEFHYCRYPEKYWDDELKKMKSGGITVVSTYVFWNVHEKKEGAFTWDGNLNLRRFVELCKSNGFDVIVRIGPFCHGEIRNGGIPDWLYGREFEIRSNDSAYLYYAEKLYHEIGIQLAGLLFKDGGPIVGIQLENEYQHSAAPWAITYSGAEKEHTVAQIDNEHTKAGVSSNASGNSFAEYGQIHMQTLKKLAIEAGLDVPIYTATGWGFATIVKGGSIPVMAGYAFPFWEEGQTLSPFYLFKNLHKHPDYSPVSYDSEDYPSLAAELGTGMSVIYSRRPRVPGESFLPMMVRTVGSGSNGLGYYMYHGGTTPSDGFFFYSEGFGLPNKSYDYQAPIREFGNPGTGFYGLKIINTFLQHYGNILAPLYPVLPETNENITPSDTATLRYSVRSDGDKGFVFLQNYQDHIRKPDLKQIQLEVNTTKGVLKIPASGSMDVLSGSSAILPFGLEIQGLKLVSATVQPLCIFENNEITYHVYCSIKGIKPEMVFKGFPHISGKNLKTFKNNSYTKVECSNNSMIEFKVNGVYFLIMPVEAAGNAYLAGKQGSQCLLISEALIVETDSGSGIDLYSMGKNRFNLITYPAKTGLKVANGMVKLKPGELFVSLFEITMPEINPVITFKKFGSRRYLMDAQTLDMTGLHDVFIKFDYKGDRMSCMLNGELITDNLYTSEPWTIGLKRYLSELKDNTMYFYFYPMHRDAPYLSYLDKEVVPDFGIEEEFLQINDPVIIPEYRFHVDFE